LVTSTAPWLSGLPVPKLALLGWGVCPRCGEDAKQLGITVMARNTSYKYWQNPIYWSYNPIEITSHFTIYNILQWVNGHHCKVAQVRWSQQQGGPNYNFTVRDLREIRYPKCEAWCWYFYQYLH
jgi:hypothetical protein